ncbi:hypothetical protein [Marinobacter bohaiensis]|uniref:hypothetical protein n=1 Tax=Marinobacter bohaiensis TaxID=2201898 RepID=UPI000DABDA98|nr:hypothetical protein [Marinobacter bohaiensis]
MKSIVTLTGLVLAGLAAASSQALELVVIEGSVELTDPDAGCVRSAVFGDRIDTEDPLAGAKGAQCASGASDPQVRAVDTLAILCEPGASDAENCVDLAAGDSKSLSELMAGEGDVRGWLSYLVASVRATAFGGKRLDSGDRLEFFPSGSVLKPKRELVIRPDYEQHRQYSDFTLISESGDTLYEQPVIDGAVRVPAEHFEFETDYAWTVRADGRTYQGEFAIAYAEDQALFQEELQAVEGYETLSPRMKALLQAAKAREWQYNFDMEQAARRYLADGGAR